MAAHTRRCARRNHERGESDDNKNHTDERAIQDSEMIRLFHEEPPLVNFGAAGHSGFRQCGASSALHNVTTLISHWYWQNTDRHWQNTDKRRRV